MKKTVLFFAVILGIFTMLQAGFATSGAPQISPKLLPLSYSSSGEIGSFEWGCPVADLVQGKNKAVALQNIAEDCLRQVSLEASKKPGVVEVIRASVIYRDVEVVEAPMQNGLYFTGTYFIKTEVLQSSHEVK